MFEALRAKAKEALVGENSLHKEPVFQDPNDIVKDATRIQLQAIIHLSSLQPLARLENWEVAKAERYTKKGKDLTPAQKAILALSMREPGF